MVLVKVVVADGCGQGGAGGGKSAVNSERLSSLRVWLDAAGQNRVRSRSESELE